MFIPNEITFLFAIIKKTTNAEEIEYASIVVLTVCTLCILLTIFLSCDSHHHAKIEKKHDRKVHDRDSSPIRKM